MPNWLVAVIVGLVAAGGLGLLDIALSKGTDLLLGDLPGGGE